MKKRFLVLLVLCFAALCAALPPGSSAAQDADALAAEGKAFFGKRDYQSAYAKYAEAFRLKPSGDLAGNLAQCEMQLGKKRDAAQHLAFAIRLAPLSTKPETKKAMAEALAGLEKELFVVRLKATPVAVDVSIDGGPVFANPSPDPIYLDPGTRSLAFSAAAHEADTRGLEAQKGGSRELVVELRRSGGAASGSASLSATGSGSASASAAPSASTSASVPTPSKPVWVPVLFGSMAAAGLGTGIGLTVAAGETNAGVDAECEDAACRDSQQVTIDEANMLLGVSSVGWGLLGVGLVGLGVGIALVVEPESPKIGFAPWVTPEGAGLTLGGSF